MSRLNPKGTLSTELWDNPEDSSATLKPRGNDLVMVLTDFEGNQKEYALEDLALLASGFMRLVDEIVYHRALIGNQVILDAWAEAGYANSLPDQDPKNAVEILRPLEKGLIDTTFISSSRRYRSQVPTQILPNLDLRVSNNRFGWCLTLDSDDTVLAFADWNDPVGIRGLAKQALETEEVFVLLALVNPEKAEELSAMDSSHKDALSVYTKARGDRLPKEVFDALDFLKTSLDTEATKIFGSTRVNCNRVAHCIANPQDALHPTPIALLYDVKWLKRDLFFEDFIPFINIANHKKWRRERKSMLVEFKVKIEKLGYLLKIDSRTYRVFHGNLQSGLILKNNNALASYKALPSYMRVKRDSRESRFGSEIGF